MREGHSWLCQLQAQLQYENGAFMQLDAMSFRDNSWVAIEAPV